MNFFIGQRVRVNCPISRRNGQECRVIGVGMDASAYGGNYVGIQVDLIDRTWGCNCIFESHELEPILPSGHQPAEVDVHELLPFLRENEKVHSPIR